MDSRTTFSDSMDISNGSSTCCQDSYTNNPQHHHSSTENDVSQGVSMPPDVAALQRLSGNFECIFGSDDFYADAKIAVAGREVAVHRCILAARSPFFKSVLASYNQREKDQQRGEGEKSRGVRFELNNLVGDFDVGYDALVTVLAYLYSGRVKRLPREICVCVDEDCPHDGCRPAVDFMVEVLYLSFIFEIAELVSLYQRHLLEILDKITTDDLLIVLSAANLCRSPCERLHTKCLEIIVKSDVDSIALEKSLPTDIVKLITDERKGLGLIGLDSNGFPDIHVKRIHRALDSDDVELVIMLLKEGHTNLDKAYALHYAAAYCDAKTTMELLGLELADVNCKNPRGFSVLHVAAMRKQPQIIMSLVDRGALSTDVTSDGRTALQILKRLTKAADWHKSPEQGKPSHWDRLCIEILQQAERKEPMFLGEGFLSLARADDEFRSSLLDLENRVSLAKVFFPEEAKVAMKIAQVDGTTEFSQFTLPKAKKTMDLNESLFIIKEEHRQRMKALEKTVTLGKTYFPRCSQELDKIMNDEDLTELANMGNGTPGEREMKRQRFMEIRDTVSKAFAEDTQAPGRSTLSSSSSSRPMSKHAGRLSYKR